MNPLHPAQLRLVVMSDPHYAGSAEQARRGWEQRAIRHPALRLLAATYRRLLWLADPTAHNPLLDAFLRAASHADLVVANGDYSCDSAFVGLADDAALASARECLARLREAFGPRLLVTTGDHEFGKMSLFGGVGGPRLRSWERCRDDLGIEALWRHDVGRCSLIGVSSSLLALPVFAPEMLADEVPAWNVLRSNFLAELNALFEALPPSQRLILFCHDPTALPFLASEPAVASRLSQVELTIIGHLHSELVLRTSRWLAGMPELRLFGNTARRLSSALRKGRAWRPFRPILCPSLAGIQLTRDGGYLEVLVDPAASTPPRVIRHHLPWAKPGPKAGPEA